MMLSNLLRGAFGGALIGLAASLLLLSHGKVAGISGMVRGLLDPTARERGYRAWFLAGLLAVGLVFALVKPDLLASAASAPLCSPPPPGCSSGSGPASGRLHQRARRLRREPALAAIDRRHGDLPRGRDAHGLRRASPRRG